MATTPKASLTLMPSGIYRNEEVYNGNLILLEALAVGAVLSRTVADPDTGSPAPQNGDVYIVSSGSPTPSGDWANQGDNIAVYYDGWKFIPAVDGMTMYCIDEQSLLLYQSGTGWTVLV